VVAGVCCWPAGEGSSASARSAVIAHAAVTSRRVHLISLRGGRSALDLLTAMFLSVSRLSVRLDDCPPSDYVLMMPYGAPPTGRV
jgi:hypothetical protein